MKFKIVPILLGLAQVSLLAAAPDLSSLKTKADLEVVIAKTDNADLKAALEENASAILDSAERHPHVVAITAMVEGANGKVEKINTTPESLKKAAGGDIALFDSLKLVDLAVPGAGPHDHRESDPYDAAFFEHLGHITTLESLNIISTKLGDDWIAPIGKLTNLKTLKFTNNGKLTDAGLEKLAGLKNLESFSFVGTGMLGHAYSKFDDLTKLVKISHRGSSIDDEGLKQLCEHVPNLESISLAHAKFTDEGAPHLAKLTKLTGLEIGTPNATAACLTNLESLPIAYLQLGDGLDAPEGIAACKNIPTLRLLTLTHCDHLTDEGLGLATELKQLEQLEIGGLDLPDERLPQLKAFSFLKELKLIRRPQGYPAETEEKIKVLLPGVEVKFK